MRFSSIEQYAATYPVCRGAMIPRIMAFPTPHLPRAQGGGERISWLARSPAEPARDVCPELRRRGERHAAGRRTLKQDRPCPATSKDIIIGIVCTRPSGISPPKQAEQSMTG